MDCVAMYHGHTIASLYRLQREVVITRAVSSENGFRVLKKLYMTSSWKPRLKEKLYMTSSWKPQKRTGSDQTTRVLRGV